MGSDAENITFISKRKEYDCNYFYLLISRINKYGDSGLNYLCPGYTIIISM